MGDEAESDNTSQFKRCEANSVTAQGAEEVLESSERQELTWYIYIYGKRGFKEES